MANIFESLDTLEQRTLGVVAWLTAHGNQLAQLTAQLEQIKSDTGDIFKIISSLKQDVKGK